MEKLILVSNSPRRRQILEEFGYKFQVHIVKVSEIIDKNLNPPEQVEEFARTKVKAGVEQLKHLNLKGKYLLGGDTMVVFNGQPIGKPADDIDALRILKQLSGQTHSVISAFCVYELDTRLCFCQQDTTSVEFKKLTEGQIQDYINSGEHLDKAGAYGIQGKAREFVSEFRGSLYNVIGFPIEKFNKFVKQKGFDFG